MSFNQKTFCVSNASARLVQNPNASRTFPGTVFAYEFSHLAVAIVAVWGCFALFEMKLAIVTILKRYKLALTEKHQVVPVRRGVTIAPQGGIKMKLIGQCSLTEASPAVMSSSH